MAYPQNQNREKSEWIFHSALVKEGPTLVRIPHAPKSVKNGTMCIVEIEKDGKSVVYKIPSQQIEEGFKAHVGQSVVLLAKGDDRRGNAEIVFQPAADGGAPPQQQAPASQPKRQGAPSMRGAKIYFHQAGNLMRIAVKKAEDVGNEFGLSDERKSAIQGQIFKGAADRGFVDAMPIDPITPQELGWATAGHQPTNEPEPAYQEPEPEDAEDNSSIPF